MFTGHYWALIDKTITAMQLSGESEKLYNRWFMSPIPPKGDVINTPLSESMRELYAHSNDRSFDD